MNRKPSETIEPACIDCGALWERFCTCAKNIPIPARAAAKSIIAEHWDREGMTMGELNLETVDLTNVNPDCTWCHGEGFKRMPADCTTASGSPFVYERIVCAGCYAQKVLSVAGLRRRPRK